MKTTAKQREYARLWRLANPDKVRAQRKSDKAIAQKKLYASKNKDRQAIWHRLWSQDNRDHLNVYKRDWINRNPDRDLMHRLQYLRTHPWVSIFPTFMSLDSVKNSNLPITNFTPRDWLEAKERFLGI